MTGDGENNMLKYKILLDLTQKTGAYDMCRGNITSGYINDTFLDPCINGFIVCDKKTNEYSGFILF